ncbi:MAG TPA: histidine phosphatase family protein [Jiangellaceae bacterium]|jgi:phosphohistidine phosphatase|nr:histidine phosphatase family protein [Jiangellaceae bacterium]
MSRTLVLVRHAKSDWPDDVADHERPLAKRGRRDAPAVGRWLVENGVLPQVMLVSSARRAVETTDLIAGELDPPPRQIVTDEAYNADPMELLELVRTLPAEADVAMLVGHNPAIEATAALLAESGTELGEFPTSAVAVLEFEGDWDSVELGEGRLLAFAAPRG